MGRHEREKIYREEAFFREGSFFGEGFATRRGWGQEQETRLGLKKNGRNCLAFPLSQGPHIWKEGGGGGRRIEEGYSHHFEKGRRLTLRERVNFEHLNGIFSISPPVRKEQKKPSTRESSAPISKIEKHPAVRGEAVMFP